MAKSEITLEEWLGELRKFDKEGAKGFSVRELQKVMQVSDRTARARLREWIEEGRVRFAGQRRGMSIEGKACVTPVYEVVKKGKKG